MKHLTNNGELLPILPRVHLALRIFNSTHQLSPDNPKLQQLARLYVQSFADWDQDLNDSHGYDLALDYLLRYGESNHGVIVILEYKEKVVGGALMNYHSKTQVCHHMMASIADSFDHTLDFADDHFSDFLYDFLYQKLTDDQHEDYIEISDFFFEEKDYFKALIAQYIEEIMADLDDYDLLAQLPQNLSLAGLQTHQSIIDLFYSFKSSRKIKQIDKTLVHDIYRLLTLTLLLATLVYIQQESGFMMGTVTCVQWTCVGTPMYNLFKLLCSPRGKRIARIFDANIPVLGRIASKMPGNQTLINALINLGKNSEIIWEGMIGDGSRPRSEDYDYNSISITKLPLDGIIAIVYNWNTYSLLVRRRYLRLRIRWLGRRYIREGQFLTERHRRRLRPAKRPRRSRRLPHRYLILQMLEDGHATEEVEVHGKSRRRFFMRRKKKEKTRSTRKRLILPRQLRSLLRKRQQKHPLETPSILELSEFMPISEVEHKPRRFRLRNRKKSSSDHEVG